MMNTELLSTQGFEALLHQEELEERVEFVKWSAGASCETDFEGNGKCQVEVRGEF